MHSILLVIGVSVAVAGGAMIAFGIPINGFDVGNTLIMAGTTAFVGGLIVVGLSETVKQLRRIAEGTGIYPAARPSRTAELFNATAAPGARTGAEPGRIPFPPKPSRDRPREAGPIEPRLPSAPALDASDDQPDRPAPSFARREAPEPQVFPDRDEAPLSPQAEPRFAMRAEREQDDLSESLLATAFSRLDVSLRPAPPAEAARQPEPFESMWPAEARPIRTEEPAQPPAPPDMPVAERHDAPDDSEPPPHAVSILKSGVVDGMAYTLYSDGSIEAEMPQGTMRFASITELRAYLEKSS